MVATGERSVTDWRTGGLSIGIPAILAGVVGAWSITVPSLWRDESVSVHFARIPLGEAWRVWSQDDAVHATYDLLLRPFIWIEPVELAARLPSLAGFVVATIAIVLVGRKLSGWSVGACAGCVYALLPVTSRFAQEARSYAIVSAVAVLATLALLRFCDRPSVGRFATYAGSIAVLGYLHLYALLLVLVHGLHLLLTSRGLIRRAVAAWATAGVLLIPLVLVASGQRERQLFWLTSPEPGDLSAFARSIGGTWAAGILLASLALAGAWALRRQPIVIIWAVVPVVVSFSVSQVYPIFNDRYVLFVVPAVALLAGAGVDMIAGAVRSRIGTAAVGVLALALIGALALPAHQDIRRPDSRDDNLRALSCDLGADLRPGDGWMPVPARYERFVNAYGEPFSRLELVPVLDPLPPDVSRIWVVTRDHPSRRTDELSDLEAVFQRERVRSYGFTHLSLWVRR